MSAIKGLVNSKKIIYILLAIIIAGQLVFTVGTFVFEKKGMFSDEVWSYGLSNSYYRPFIYGQNDAYAWQLHGDEYEEYLDNVNQWVDNDVLTDYVTVDKDNAFSYDSVYYNQQHDVHPPLYYWVLHTISSFFSGTFSVWFGFSINLLALVVSQIFLFRLSRLVTKSDVGALQVCFFWAFTHGALNNFIYLRMYALSTCLVIVTTYYHARLFKGDKLKSVLPFICIATFLGALTLNIFYLYAFILSACICIWLLCKKQIKRLLCYSAGMLFAVAAALAVFPYVFSQISNCPMPMKMPLWIQFWYVLRYLLYDVFGFGVIAYKSATPYIIAAAVGCVLLLLCPLLFLFRKSKLEKKIFSAVKSFFIRVGKSFLKFDWFVFFLFLEICIIIVVMGLSISTLYVGVSLDRYVFYLFPIICLMSVTMARYILKWLRVNRKISVLVVVLLTSVCCVASNLNSPSIYLYSQTYSVNDTISALENSDVIVVTPDVKRFTAFSVYAMKADKVFFTTRQMIKSNYDKINELDSGKKMYLVYASLDPKPEDCTAEVSQLLSGITNADKPEYVFTIDINGYNGFVFEC